MKMRILVLLLFCCGIGGRSYAGVVYTIDVFGKNLAIPQPEGLGINLDHSENFLKGKVPFGTKNQYDIDIVRFTDIAAEKTGSEYCIGITVGRREYTDSGSQDMGGIRVYIAEMKNKSSKYARFLTGDFDIFVNSHNAAKANFSVQYPKDFYKDETISNGYKLVRFTKLPAAQENDYWLSISVGDGLDILKYKDWTEQVKALCLENCHYRQPDSFFLEGDAGTVVSRKKNINKPASCRYHLNQKKSGD